MSNLFRTTTESAYEGARITQHHDYLPHGGLVKVTTIATLADGRVGRDEVEVREAALNSTDPNLDVVGDRIRAAIANAEGK